MLAAARWVVDRVNVNWSCCIESKAPSDSGLIYITRTMSTSYKQFGRRFPEPSCSGPHTLLSALLASHRLCNRGYSSHLAIAYLSPLVTKQTAAAVPRRQLARCFTVRRSTEASPHCSAAEFVCRWLPRRGSVRNEQENTDAIQRLRWCWYILGHAYLGYQFSMQA